MREGGNEQQGSQVTFDTVSDGCTHHTWHVVPCRGGAVAQVVIRMHACVVRGRGENYWVATIMHKHDGGAHVYRRVRM